MRYHPPRRDHIPEEELEIYQHVVERAYRFHDMMLGTLLALAGEETTVIHISDHGFHSDHLRPRSIPLEPAGPAVEHSFHGIFAMKGPGVRSDERVYGANLLDVAPTILTLLGLPTGADMDGKPLVEAFEEAPAVDTIPSWEDVAGPDGRHPEEMRVDPEENQAALDQLAALGYIEKQADDRERAAENAVREARFHLAEGYADAGMSRESLELTERLWADWPDEPRFGIKLVQDYLAALRMGDARRVAEELFSCLDGMAAAAQKIARPPDELRAPAGVVEAVPHGVNPDGGRQER